MRHFLSLQLLHDVRFFLLMTHSPLFLHSPSAFRLLYVRPKKDCKRKKSGKLVKEDDKDDGKIEEKQRSSVEQRQMRIVQMSLSNGQESKESAVKLSCTPYRLPSAPKHPATVALVTESRICIGRPSTIYLKLKNRALMVRENERQFGGKMTPR